MHERAPLKAGTGPRSALRIRRIAFYALLLNALWEFVQCVLFYDMWSMGFGRATLWMWSAILGDVLIVLGVAFLAQWLVGPRHLDPLDRRGWLVLLAVGLAAGVLLEWLARVLGLWSYGPLMPTVKVFGATVGLLPILQVMLLPALSVRLAAGRVRSGELRPPG
jgi:hypothetical protein